MTSTTTCTDAWRRRVSDYHDGGVAGPERAEIEAHINACSACQAALASYDRLYKQMRSLPGFEGMLTLTRPGTRRGLGGNARPMFTWPGSSASGSQGRRGAASAGGGSIAIALILLLMVAFLLNHNTAVFAPLAAPNATVPTIGATPTLGLRTANGLGCANAFALENQPYLYAGAQGALWRVQGCGTPTRLATLNLADFRLGTVSPDDQNITAFAPASPRTGRPQLFVLSSKNGALQEFDLRAPNDPATSLAIDDAAWSSATTLIVLAQQRVLTLDITTRASAVLPFSADHIAWRAPTLFYSTVNQGQATLHRYNLATKADTVNATLSVAPPGCATPEQCAPVTAPWDISADSGTVYFQKVLTRASQGQLSVLIAQPLLSNKEAEIFRVASNLPMVISAAPDNLAIAALWTDSSATRHLKLATLGNGLTQDYPGQTALVWRPDSQALLNMPAAPQAGAAPHLILLIGNRDIALSDATADYMWLP